MRMIEIRQTDAFHKWFKKLKDLRAKAKIQVRLDRLLLGNAGDVRPIGEGISEMRISEGKGYRVYLVSRDDVLVILLCGGNKSSQQRDISKAKLLAKQLEQNNGYQNNNV